MSSHLAKNHPAHIFLMLYRHRNLILQLIKRDILTKYRGSFGGLLWLLLLPILMLSLYTLVFTVFMHVQWPGVTNKLMYSLIIYVGLIVLNFFSECLSRSPGIIVNNSNFVKKVIFPLEIYPWVIVGSAFFQVMVNILILSVFCLLLLGKIYLSIFLLPILFLPLILVTLGISWFLCSAGVFVRDITHMMVFVMQIIMYLSPIFYSISMLPAVFQTLLLINPLTFIIEQTRSLIIFGNPLQWTGLGVYYVISFFIAYLGFLGFQKTREGFADVL